jgi:hypothetical protein
MLGTDGLVAEVDCFFLFATGSSSLGLAYVEFAQSYAVMYVDKQGMGFKRGFHANKPHLRKKTTNSHPTCAQT